MKQLYYCFLFITGFVLFILLLISAYSSTLDNSTSFLFFPPHLCLNLPSKQQIHPVFLGNGPSLQAFPRPSIIIPVESRQSSTIQCELISNKTVIIVHSHIDNIEWRHFQRSQFNKKWLVEVVKKSKLIVTILIQNNAVIYFITALRNESNNIDEINQFNDLIQIDIEENYHNISYKAQFWINKLANCAFPPILIVKIDDDVNVELIGLEFLINRYSKLNDFLACRVFPHGVVVRNPNSKWYLSKQEYLFNDLGTYCQGMTYLISGNLMKIMQKNIELNQYLWMDDWYVTRSLIGNHKVSYYSLEQHIISTNSENDLKSALEALKKKKNRIIFTHFRPAEKFPLNRQAKIWKKIHQLNERC